MDNINNLLKKCHNTSREKGFWKIEEKVIKTIEKLDTYFNKEDIEYIKRAFKAQRIALMHSELSEMLEGIRSKDNNNEGEELADVIIRANDYAGGYNIKLDQEISDKMEVNKERPKLHGKNF